jgi:hypothetical protein
MTTPTAGARRSRLPGSGSDSARASIPTPQGEGRSRPGPSRRCRGCGCTDDHACPGGCAWHDLDLAGGHGGPLCTRCARHLVVYGDFEVRPDRHPDRPAPEALTA